MGAGRGGRIENKKTKGGRGGQGGWGGEEEGRVLGISLYFNATRMFH